MLGQFVRLWRYDRSCTSAVAFTKNENYYRVFWWHAGGWVLWSSLGGWGLSGGRRSGPRPCTCGSRRVAVCLVSSGVRGLKMNA
jgi:hypothetical protein